MLYFEGINIAPLFLHVLLDQHQVLSAQHDVLPRFVGLRAELAHQLVFQLELITAVLLRLHKEVVRNVTSAVPSERQYGELHHQHILAEFRRLHQVLLAFIAHILNIEFQHVGLEVRSLVVFEGVLLSVILIDVWLNNLLLDRDCSVHVFLGLCIL